MHRTLAIALLAAVTIPAAIQDRAPERPSGTVSIQPIPAPEPAPTPRLRERPDR